MGRYYLQLHQRFRRQVQSLFSNQWIYLLHLLHP
ncbi:DUF3699 domain-containing protein [Stenotrophomonas maltophilia]|nr:DUF3699 domain-containing protein [Stenotrophomonas maltophilia]MBA0411309.1 DUF3699 domain-containing protein [Stenotrophomonas maltophilia]MBA0496412.1 DUF3699 domain-containing protein [Stenotrophomonas maltophilia]MBA0500594.1 DUF3699 domain-containing protein [Stenotrophomonas maltophilia]MBA0505846.1 DUF3699 domain-containing protein [Stenotrophomonas maltophilia]